MGEVSDVGLDLVERLEATVNEKVYNAIALRIRTKVLGARSDPDTSSRRWPFELIQNAHDAGARANREGISLGITVTVHQLYSEWRAKSSPKHAATTCRNTFLSCRSPARRRRCNPLPGTSDALRPYRLPIFGILSYIG